MLFDHSITVFYSKPPAHFSEFKHIELMDERANSMVLEPVFGINGGDSSEQSVTLHEDDPELKSDADSGRLHRRQEVNNVDDDDNHDVWLDQDERCIDELVVEAGTARKKLELLAGMVGVDSSKEPAWVVLAEVVRVIKELKKRNGYQHLV